MAKKKRKSAPIFPPETGENKMPSPALQSPANAAAASASFAGLGAVGSINEDEIVPLMFEKPDGELEEFLEHLRQEIWRSFDASELS